MKKEMDLHFLTESLHGFTLNVWRDGEGFLGRILGYRYLMPAGVPEGVPVPMSIVLDAGAPEQIKNTDRYELVEPCRIRVEELGGKIDRCFRL